MKGVQQQQQQEMVGEDLHAGGGNEGNRSVFDGVVEVERAMGGEEREIWLGNTHQDDELLDVNDASIFYADFPPLPDFPCMSSSSSSSSAPAPVKAIACSSSASTASSSSSAASWAVLKSDADEDMERKNHAHHQQQQHQHHGQAALSSTASMEMPQPPDQNIVDGVDCMDIMETFGYMDLFDNNDFFDPSSIFHHDDTGLEEFQQDHSQKQQQEHESTQQQLEQGGGIIDGKNEGQSQEDKASDDLAMVFLEWLKSNKETVSAEDLRRVKIKKATIECAARRLGGGKEAMKQLLKLILEWVQTNHLQKRRFKESTDNLPYQYSNPNLNCNSILPSESNSCFSQPAWIPPYVTDPAPPLPGFAPVVGYMGDPFANGAAPNVTTHGHHPYQPPTDYQMLDSAQTWPPSQFALASQYNSFQDNNLHQAPLQQPSAFPYVNQYPYQYVPGHNNDQRLVRLGSSATKEARKKRMARQRRFASHHRNHSHQNNQQNQLQNRSVDQHQRLVNDNCAQANPGNWVYWPSVAGALAPNPPVLPGDVTMVQPVERPAAMQGQTYQQRQVAPDKRQGWKPEKNLRFLLQKVLKQSDVGNLGRIVLPKKEAETHLPELEARDGISIAMEDIGTSRVWNMRYRFWPNNKSRMYLLENTGDFVRTNGLQEGDFIVIYSDVKCGKYLIRGVKVRQSGTKSETKRPGKSQKNQHTNSPAVAAVNGLLPTPITQAVR
ncbi:SUGAR INSENSITIVE 10, ABSCISIC ACID INSENSITIVE 3, ABA INSENSITIVE 3 [Hibiscus trionum]|uniref:SUGAR INSENSITIVE 10, ABSCISIC ACID INSENSITIVE 3, ABA INSENSITIVE 3 n=1 Tax=Hibiscus trionum TaxID=183268 RepID=A0A9W7IQY9_HIBTR|nr:SUGAR INSENSITIVE 10, ABSCISIC ACID INSENSITIVE 3, ABA INSENSITIVE 3 [Hibiscus trionum]